MSRKQGVGQIIKASVTVVTRIALTGGFRVIKATLDDLYRPTRGARHAVGPAQLADRLITLHIIDEILNVDLHGWTPVRDRGMRCRQFTPSSHATTLESNKSDPRSDAHLTGSLRGAGAGCLPEILQLPPPQEEGHLLPRTAPLPTAVVQSPRGWPGHTPSAAGSVPKVEMVTPMALIYKVL